MSDTYTNDKTGEKYVIVHDDIPMYFKSNPEELRIKPIAKAEEKKPLEFIWYLQMGSGEDKPILNHERLLFTMKEAVAIADAIEALMEYMTADKFPDSYAKIIKTVDKAYELLQDKE